MFPGDYPLLVVRPEEEQFFPTCPGGQENLSGVVPASSKNARENPCLHMFVELYIGIHQGAQFLTLFRVWPWWDGLRYLMESIRADWPFGLRVYVPRALRPTSAAGQPPTEVFRLELPKRSS
jgi:hypothetical protein